MRQRRILCVEDDPDGQELIVAILTHLNIAVDVASSAEQAETFLFHQWRTYDAIIVDLALPGKDGWTLLHQIRNDPHTHQVLCIAVTAFHTARIRNVALQSGFDAYFAKPLDVITFGQQIKSWM